MFMYIILHTVYKYIYIYIFVEAPLKARVIYKGGEGEYVWYILIILYCIPSMGDSRGLDGSLLYIFFFSSNK